MGQRGGGIHGRVGKIHTALQCNAMASFEVCGDDGWGERKKKKNFC